MALPLLLVGAATAIAIWRASKSTTTKHLPPTLPPGPFPKGPLDDVLIAASHLLGDDDTEHTVNRPRVGSVVYCGLLFGQVEHSGVYVGKGKIVSLSGDGEIVKQDPHEFLDGITTGDTIYVSCKGKSPVGKKGVGGRARQMVGGQRDYNFLLDNCHQFTSGCLTGDFENADNLFTLLEARAENVLGADNWLRWDEDEFF